MAVIIYLVLRGEVMLKKLLLSLIIAVPVVAQADWMEWNKDDEFTTYIDPE